jgi:glycosyltransferase involved in cell wall biosynthesis
LRTDVVVAIPFADWVRKMESGERPSRWSAMRETLPAGHRIHPEYAAQVAADAVRGLTDADHVCSLTILAPVVPESEVSTPNEKDGTSFAQAQQRFQSLMQKAGGFAVDAALCGAAQRTVKFVEIHPQSRTVAAWHRAVLMQVAAVAEDPRVVRTPDAVIVLRESTVAPADHARWLRGLESLPHKNGAVATGCPVYVNSSEPIVHAYGYEPHRVRQRDGISLLRSLGGYTQREAPYATGPNGDADAGMEVFAPTPACLGARSRLLAQAIRGVMQQTPVPDLDAVVASGAAALVAAGGLRGAVSRFGALVSGISELAEKTQEAHKIARSRHEGRSPTPQSDLLGELEQRLVRMRDALGGTNHQANLVASQVERIVERAEKSRELAAWRKEGKRRTPWLPGDHADRDDAFYDAVCSDPAAEAAVLNKLPSRSPCVLRTGSQVTWCEDGEATFQKVARSYPGWLEHDTPDTEPLLAAAASLAPVISTATGVVKCLADGATGQSACDVHGFITLLDFEMNQASALRRELAELADRTFAALQRHHTACSVGRRGAVWSQLIQLIADQRVGFRSVHSARVGIASGIPVPGGTVTHPDGSHVIESRFDSLVLDESIDLGSGIGQMHDTFKRLPSAGSPAAGFGLALAAERPPKHYVSTGLALRGHAQLVSSYLSSSVRLEWALPCCICCGFSVEAAWILRGLAKYADTLTPQSPDCHCKGMPQVQAEALWSMWTRSSDPVLNQPELGLHTPRQVKVALYHWDPLHSLTDMDMSPSPMIHYRISRAMYEFAAIPTNWVAPLTEVFDEVWVPTGVMKRTLVGAGIPAAKIEIVPEPIDTLYFAPDDAKRVTLPQHIVDRNWNAAAIGGPRDAASASTHVKLLSIFKLEPRKGWDALLQAYLTAFDANDKVTLYIATYWWNPLMPAGVTRERNVTSIHETILAHARDFLRAAGRGDAKLPHIVLITEEMTDDEIVSLYQSCDAFVLPSRGEGWGLPIIQAMSMGLPTITTRHSGMLEFTTRDTVLYVDVDEREPPEGVQRIYDTPKGAKWGDPRVPQLTEQLRRVVSMTPEGRRQLGARARKHVEENFSIDGIGRAIAKRLGAIEAKVRSEWERQATARKAADVQLVNKLKKAAARDRVG